MTSIFDRLCQTPSESQDNAVLEAFLRSSAALRSMLDGTEIRIRDALAAYRESVQDRTELKNMMRTSQELQHRAHELLRYDTGGATWHV